MNEPSYLKIYLRRTTGVGQKIIINSLVTFRHLYTSAAQIFGLPETSFGIYYHGNKLGEKPETTLQDLNLQPECILHIQENKQQLSGKQNLPIELRVFCQGSLYNYTTSTTTTFRELKSEVANMLGCAIAAVTITYLGKNMQEFRSLADEGMKNRDIISVLVSQLPMDRIRERSSVSWLKPKMTESHTFANTEEMDPNYQPFTKQIMRKSSMKSSHESRELRREQSKRLLHVIRPKSELSRSNSKLEPETEEHPVQFAWLTNQKVIETESINFDESEEEEGPDSWTICHIQICNEARTMFYTVECCEEHVLKNVVDIIRKNERLETELTIMFGDEISQQMAELGKSMLFIAKASGTQIIKNAIFKF